MISPIKFDNNIHEGGLKIGANFNIDDDDLHYFTENNLQ